MAGSDLCWWLQHPTTLWTLRFELCGDRFRRPWLVVILGQPQGDQPALLKWRRELARREARELWRIRRGQGWEPCGAQW